MSPYAFVVPSGETERGTAWQEHLSHQINKHVAAEGDSYTLIAAAQLGSVAAFAFVRSTHLPQVSSLTVRSCSIGLDLGVGNARNKAAIELRFALAGAKVAFISSHFAPHEGHCAERCHFLSYISSTLTFSNCKTAPNRIFHLFAMECHSAFRNANFKQVIDYFFDSSNDNNVTLFFCGDLNYRLSCGREHAYSLLQGRDISSVTPAVTHILQGLILYDELLLQRKTGGAFGGFSEASINFFPTFKFDVGSMVYVQ